MTDSSEASGNGKASDGCKYRKKAVLLIDKPAPRRLPTHLIDSREQSLPGWARECRPLWPPGCDGDNRRLAIDRAK